jgi:hypothetical protein
MSVLLLKLIGYFSMTYDHLGFFGGDTMLRVIGRLAFPIFCFLIAQGCRNTKNIWKYIARLGALALISEIPYNYFVSGKLLHPSGQNVIWTLLLGLICISLRRVWKEKCGKFYVGAYVVTVIAFCMAANLFTTDYNYFGVMTIVIFDLFPMQTNKEKLFGSLAFIGLYAYRFASYGLYLFFTLNLKIEPALFPMLGRFLLNNIGDWELIKITSIAALPLLWFYNGKKGTLGDKKMDKVLNYIFYLYYPVHILLIALLYRL